MMNKLLEQSPMSPRQLLPLAILLLLAGCANRPESGQDTWQPFDQDPVLAELQSNPNPRMQLKLINSRVLDKNDLWRSFDKALDDVGQELYEQLKPVVLHKSFAQLQQAVSARQLSYEQLALFYLYRIRELESDNTRSLNALIATNPELLVQARAKDRQRVANPQLPLQFPLFGLPILVKDNIGVAGMPTTAGAMALQHNMTADAAIIRQLQAAGALVLGKANLSEWAYFFCAGCPLGYSAVGGQTMNPFGRLVLETGGSSAGSGVGVAADYAAGAIGTETAGSILSPSSLNALVGLNPGTGSLSRNGIVPIAGLFDTPGPMVRSVADAITLFNALAGYDPDDAMMDAARAG
jgi:amidase